MSFGVGFGDVYTLCKLVSRTHTGWRDAYGDYASFTNDLALLESVLNRVEAEVNSPNSRTLDTPEDAEGWRIVSERCSSVVTELEGVLKSYKSLGSSRRRNWDGIRREWDKLRFGTRNCEDLHRQLAKATDGLTAYVTVLGLSSHNRVEHSMFPQIIERIDGLAAQMRKGNSTTRSRMTVHSDDDVGVWREWRRDLIHSGFRSSDIHRYSAALKTYLLHLKRDGMLDEEEPISAVNEVPVNDIGVPASPKIGDTSPGTMLLSTPLLLAPLFDNSAGVNLSTIAEDPDTGLASGKKAPQSADLSARNFQSLFVEDAQEENIETKKAFGGGDQEVWHDDVSPEVDAIKNEDHVANIGASKSIIPTVSTTTEPSESTHPILLRPTRIRTDGPARGPGRLAKQTTSQALRDMVTNVFGRVHWVREESQTISYAPPPKVEGKVYKDKRDRIGHGYWPWGPVGTLNTDDTDLVCQIEASVWGHGISDEAAKVRGDLWWGAANVRERKLRLTRPGGRIETIYRDASNRAAD